MRGITSKFIVSMVDLKYNGETSVEERDCEKFLKTLREYKILKVKSNDETKKISDVISTTEDSVRLQTVCLNIQRRIVNLT